MSRPDLDVQGTFRSVVEALQESGLPYAFIGALPVLAWGRVRATTDIDLVVAVGSDWNKLEQALENRDLRRSTDVGPTVIQATSGRCGRRPGKLSERSFSDAATPP